MSPSTFVPCRPPDEIEDAPTATLGSGARRPLAQAIGAFLAMLASVRLPDGRERLVRPGYGPESQVQTGIGPVAIRRVKPRDRGTDDAAERIRFTASILPRWARRTPSPDALLPDRYPHGTSMGVPAGARGAVGQGRRERVAVPGREAAPYDPLPQHPTSQPGSRPSCPCKN